MFALLVVLLAMSLVSVLSTNEEDVTLVGTKTKQQRTEMTMSNQSFVTRIYDDDKHANERELQSTICSGNTWRCEQLGKDGRWMNRKIGNIWCREECVYPNWQGVRRRFGWRCGFCNDR